MSIATDSDYVALSEKYGAIYYCPKGHLYANFKTANSFHCNACDDVKVARVELLELLREWRDAQEPAEAYDDRVARTDKVLDEN